MRMLKHLKQKIPALSLGILIGVSVGVVACKTAPPQYTICISDPLHGGLVCNKTGKSTDNFFVDFGHSENYRCLPEPDWAQLQQELNICRKKP